MSKDNEYCLAVGGKMISAHELAIVWSIRHDSIMPVEIDDFKRMGDNITVEFGSFEKFHEKHKISEQEGLTIKQHWLLRRIESIIEEEIYGNKL